MTGKITILIIGLLVSFITTQAQNWYQIGEDIDGESSNGRSGEAVSLNSDGSIIAIGAPQNNGSGSYAGHVRIYQNNDGSWTQVGADIDAESSNDYFGTSVSLSSDGSIVAIGAYRNEGTSSLAGHVRIYKNQSGTWSQIGADIDGEATEDYSGSSVSLSSNGSIVAIGAPSNDGNGSNAGHVRIYENQSETWTQVGADIDGESSNDYFGYSVSLSSNGSVVAIGGYYNEENGSMSGHVRIYENQSGTWIQIGTDIDGESYGDRSGSSVSLSSDGLIVAIGATHNDGNGSNSGHVRIYENQSGTWIQIGTDIDGETSSDYSGSSVSLSSDGSVVVIGARNNDGNGSNAGHARVYENQSGTWTQIGADIDGESSGDYSGHVSLSSDGSIVAIGASLNSEIGYFFGHVRIYEYLQLPIITSQPANQTDICVGSNVSFTVTGDNIDTYQWQVNEGSGFENITNGGVYSNATTTTLNITDIELIMNNYLYRCYITNGDGNITSNVAILSIETEDPETPTLTDLTDQCSVTAIAPTTTDNCAGTITATTTDPTEYTEQGTYVISWNFADGNGNDINVNQNVIITDNTDPETPTLADLNGQCSVTATTPTTTDNCAGTVTGTTTDPTEYTEQGTYVISWNFTDDNGNDINVNQNVIINDNTNPTITCIGNQTKQLTEEQTVYTVVGTEFDPTATDDNCGIASVTNDFNDLTTLENAEFPIGLTTVIWTITDNYDNFATCNFDVQVNAFVNIETLQQNGILIYPNPTNGILNFDFTDNNVQQIKISDLTGKTIIEKTEINQNEMIDLSSFESGIYIIKIQTDNEIFTTKIVKE